MIRRLLLVDDDVSLVRILAAALAEEDFTVVAAHDGVTALGLIERDPPDLVILDVLLPELDGLSLCRRIRARSRLPIILLSSRAEEVDRIAGLDMGADDYVTKPFSTRELCARIRAIDRRVSPRPDAVGAAAGHDGASSGGTGGATSGGHGGASSGDIAGATIGHGGGVTTGQGAGASIRADAGAATGRSAGGSRRDGAEVVVAGELQVDLRRFAVRWRGQPVELTRSELQLLLVLARERGFVLSRDRLLDLVRGSDVTTTDRTIDTFVKRIRKKVRAIDPDFDEIETVFGVGYRYK